MPATDQVLNMLNSAEHVVQHAKSPEYRGIWVFAERAERICAMRDVCQKRSTAPHSVSVPAKTAPFRGKIAIRVLNIDVQHCSARSALRHDRAPP